jgi:hypothetical protein
MTLALSLAVGCIINRWGIPSGAVGCIINVWVFPLARLGLKFFRWVVNQYQTLRLKIFIYKKGG